MATEVYQPPQELGLITSLYSLPTDITGSSVYDDPNDVVFLGDLHLAGNSPTATVA